MVLLAVPVVLVQRPQVADVQPVSVEHRDQEKMEMLHSHTGRLVLRLGPERHSPSSESAAQALQIPEGHLGPRATRDPFQMLRLVEASVLEV